MTSGRKTILDETRIAAICADAKKGYTDAIVISRAGIATRTFYQWKQKGESDIERGRDTIYAQFMHEYTRAINEANKNAIDVLQDQLKNGTESSIEEIEEIWENGKQVSKTVRQKIMRNPVDWRLASDWLSRRDKLNFSLRQEITGADGEGLQIEINWIDPPNAKNND